MKSTASRAAGNMFLVKCLQGKFSLKWDFKSVLYLFSLCRKAHSTCTYPLSMTPNR